MKRILHILVIVYTLYFLTWLILNFTNIEFPDLAYNLFTDTYGILAAIGGIGGLVASKKWGGRTSMFGKAILLLSIGLLFQFLGQVSYAIYHYVYHVENPYPSFGEIFYFGSIPIYIVGIFLFAKSIGSFYMIKKASSMLLLIAVPLIALAFSYKLFLSDYIFSGVTPVTAFLDVGYPIGQSLYVSGAVLALLLSLKVLGGALRNVVLFLLLALIFQYFADTFFLYQTYSETWTEAGSSDMLFATAYTLMGIALLQIGLKSDILSKS